MLFILSEKGEKGQGLVEYALILVLISITVIVMVGLLGEELVGIFNSVSDSL